MLFVPVGAFHVHHFESFRIITAETVQQSDTAALHTVRMLFVKYFVKVVGKILAL